VALVFLLTASALAQTAQTTPEKPRPASISGVVREAASGKPLPDARVVVGNRDISDAADAQGRYTLRDVPPGQYTIYAFDPTGAMAQARVTVAPGQDLASIDLRISRLGAIAGRVVDENKEPVPGVGVFLIDRSYALGELAYGLRDLVTTDDRGEFRLNRAIAGRPYLLLARRRVSTLDGFSDAPAEAKLRKPTLMPAYYPSSPLPEGAQMVTAPAGGVRDGVEIRVAKTPNYCIDGVMDAPSFWLVEQQPSTRLALHSEGGAGVIMGGPRGKPGPEGKFRICDLHPGQYRLAVFGAAAQGAPLSAGIMALTIADSDIHDIRATAGMGAPLRGDVVWDSPPPEGAPETKILVVLEPLFTRPSSSEGRVAAAIPGPFRFESVILDDYYWRVTGLPRGAYLKDATYGGLGIVNKPLRMGSAMGNAALHIVIGREGGFVAARVSDKDSNPVAQATVIVAPDGVRSEAEFAEAMTVGQTDQTGIFNTAALAPGKYFVWTSGAMDYTPETIGRLFRARTKAKEVEIGPDRTVQVTLSPMELD
jgi:hypothetical protein